MKIVFEEVALKGVRRWKDADGKKHQETKKFWQTINPFNKDENGLPKTREQIYDELKAKRAAWLNEAMPPHPI